VTLRRSELFNRFEREFADDPEAIADGIVLDLIYRVTEEMERQGITAAELARRMNRSRQYVSRFLEGPGNTTILTIVRFAQALGLEVSRLVSVPSAEGCRERRGPAAEMGREPVLQKPWPEPATPVMTFTSEGVLNAELGLAA
jgi:transcriptional regulator with XRE-family HTH domain